MLIVDTSLRHKRAPQALHFPTEAEVPETKRHLELRTTLYALLKGEFAAVAWVGSDQFVYWDASDPRRCLAPDVFVRRGGPDCSFDSWKTWERGAPELAVEITSESDDDARAWTTKLERYRALGVEELVRFDARAAAGGRIEVWDRIHGDLVERAIDGDRTPCRVLGLHWVVAPADGEPSALRLARDVDGADLVPTAAELREAAGRERDAAERGREAAERRVAELEAELARRPG